MPLSKPLTRLLRCRKGDTARIAKVLKVLGERTDAAIEGEMLIVVIKKPVSSKRESSSRKTARRKKTAAR